MRALALALTLSLTTASLPAAAFDFETGNGATEVVITTAVPTIFGRYPSGSEASFILRITTLSLMYTLSSSSWSPVPSC